MTDKIKQHGGRRAGAGRPKAPPVMLHAMTPTRDPLEFLRQVLDNPANDARLRLKAAAILMPYLHTKMGEGGKKDARQNAAKVAGQGRFKASPAPLKVVPIKPT